jgi:FkbM family methyltransferase
MPGLIVEVGANMGIHTIPLALELARQGRGMLVFEPQPVIFQQLCANLAINGLMNVTALPYACGAKPGMVGFEVPDYRKHGNFGGLAMEAPAESQARVENVPRVPLDDIVPSAPVGLLKIDVEGQELAVLEGAAHLLVRSRPVLYIENDRPENSPALIQWLWAHGYQMWWHTPSLFNPANLRGDSENVYGDTVSFNMLCFPEPNEHALHGFVKVTDAQAHPLLRSQDK